jgi:peptidoglycan hydrolase CwlO-like protein
MNSIFLKSMLLPTTILQRRCRSPASPLPSGRASVAGAPHIFEINIPPEQLNHSAKEVQMHQKNMTTQVAALKNEFDQSVRAAGAKTRELDKTDMELKRSVADQSKQVARLTVQMKAADNMVDAVKESTRKVKAQEQKIIGIEDTLRSIKDELQGVDELRRLADSTRTDTDSLMPRVQAVEDSSQELMQKVAEAQERADTAHDKIEQLNADLDVEREERVRIQDAHASAMDGLRSDFALLVNALGGRSQLDVEAFSSIKPPSNSRGALDVTDARIKRVTDAQSKLVKEFQRVEDLEVRHDMTAKELQKAQAQLKTMTETESELALKLSFYDRWRQKLESRLDDLDARGRAAAEAAEATAAAVAAAAVADPGAQEDPRKASESAAASAAGHKQPNLPKPAPPSVRPEVAQGGTPPPAVPNGALEEMEAVLHKSIEGLRADLNSALEEMEILKSQMEKVHALGFVPRASNQEGAERSGPGLPRDALKDEEGPRQEGTQGGSQTLGGRRDGAGTEAAHGTRDAGSSESANKGPHLPESSAEPSADNRSGWAVTAVVGAGSESRGLDQAAEGEPRDGGNAAGATSKAKSKLAIPERPVGSTGLAVSRTAFV